jgi:histidinol-phosphatase (PHP family)
MQSGRYLYLAHPDLIYFTGDKEIYDKYMYRLCRELKELGMPLELNVLGLADHRHYPAERFLKIAAETGNPFILGIDAHTPEQLQNRQALGRAEELCGKHGIQLMDDRILL